VCIILSAGGPIHEFLVANWEFVNLDADDVASFDNVLRLYSTNEGVNEHSSKPVKKIVTEHTGIGAKRQLVAKPTTLTARFISV
jgi:hypothetical protein